MIQYIKNIFSSKCPRCHKGNLFVNPWYNFSSGTKMHDKCPVCGQRTQLEPGFYHGTGYVSYALTVGISIITFVAWMAITGYSFKDPEILWWFPLDVVLLLILQPWLMRFSRTLWLTMFFHDDDKYHQSSTSHN